MASYSLIYGGYVNASGADADIYAPIDCVWTLGSTANSSAVDFRLANGVTASLSKLTLHVGSNTQSTDTTVTLEVGGVATALTLTIPAGDTGWFATTTETATFDSGDKLVYHVERGDAGDISIDSMTMLLTKNGEDTATWILGCGVTSTIGTLDPVSGLGIFTAPRRAVGTDTANDYADEAYQFRYNVRTAATAKYLQCYVTANTRDEDAIYKVYKNGAATDIAITLTAGQTGWFIDTTHTASFAVGDKLSYAIISEAAATTGEITLDSIHLMMESGSTSQDIVAGGNAGIVLYDGTNYPNEEGLAAQGYLDKQNNSPLVPEPSRFAIKLPVAGTMSKLSFSYTNYGLYEGFTDETFYARTMYDGVQRDQRINVDATAIPDQNGVAEDEGNTDTVTAGEEYYVEFGLRQPNQATTDVGCEADIWSISARYTPESAGDEFGCVKSCEGSETYYSLVNKTLKMLGEDPDAPIYWSAAEIGRYVNDAYIEACRESKALELIEAVQLSAGIGTLSANVGQVFRVSFDDRKIGNVTKWELDRAATDWEAQEGFVSNYITSLQDNRTIRTYQKWSDQGEYSVGPFLAGAYTYTTWATSTAYTTSSRVTRTQTDGTIRGYACILNHTSGTSSAPESGASWATYWVALPMTVWAVKVPDTLSACDEPELPCWSHLGLAFRAAAKALGKYGEQRDEGMAQVYDAIASDYMKLLKAYVSTRMPEQMMVVGARVPLQGLRKPQPWDTPVEEP